MQYCTETLRADGKHNPAAMKNATLKKGETVANYAESIIAAKWRGKQSVLYISTQFFNEMVQATNKHKQVKDLPKVNYAI